MLKSRYQTERYKGERSFLAIPVFCPNTSDRPLKGKKPPEVSTPTITSMDCVEVSAFQQAPGDYDFVVVDCMLLAYRMWWGVKDFKTYGGVHTGLEFGFLNGLLSIIRNWMPAEVVLAWDGDATRCKSIFPPETLADGTEIGYKSGRIKHETKEDEEDEDPWPARLERLKQALSQCTTSLYDPDMEADEQIARFVHQTSQAGKRCLIISKDKDFHQLISETVHLTVAASSDLLYTPKEIEEEWGCPPEKVLFRRCIEGDSSDAIKGIPRFPKKLLPEVANRVSSYKDLVELFRNGGKGLSKPFTKAMGVKCWDAVTLPSHEYHAKYYVKKDKVTGIVTPTAPCPECEHPVVLRNYMLMNLKEEGKKPPIFMRNNRGDVTSILSLAVELEFRDIPDRKEWELFKETPEDTYIFGS